MRLIDRKERNLCLMCKGDKRRVLEALRRHVHEVIPAGQSTREHDALLSRSERAVEIGATDACLLERAHLVAHERDQRRDDNREA